MTVSLPKIFGLGAVLSLLAGPALAQEYGSDGGYGYAPPCHSWYGHEQREAAWHEHEWHEHEWHEHEEHQYWDHDHGYDE
jgi:hypothetical protein